MYMVKSFERGCCRFVEGDIIRDPKTGIQYVLCASSDGATMFWVANDKYNSQYSIDSLPYAYDGSWVCVGNRGINANQNINTCAEERLGETKQPLLTCLSPTPVRFCGIYASPAYIPTRAEKYPNYDMYGIPPQKGDVLIVENVKTGTKAQTWQYVYIGDWSADGALGWERNFIITDFPVEQKQDLRIDKKRAITEEIENSWVLYLPVRNKDCLHDQDVIRSVLSGWEYELRYDKSNGTWTGYSAQSPIGIYVPVLDLDLSQFEYVCNRGKKQCKHSH